MSRTQGLERIKFVVFISRSLKLLMRRSKMSRCLTYCYLILLFTFIVICRVSCHEKNDFCERDETTGSCKSNVSSKQDKVEEDGPCWMGDETTSKPKKAKRNEKLVRLDGVKVC